MNPKIQAIFKSTGVSSCDYGKKGVLIFTDLTLDGEFLADSYSFSALKSFNKFKPKFGDIFEFEAEVCKKVGLSIKRPKNIKKIDLTHLEKPFEYCLNKFLKKIKVLSKDEIRGERIAFIKLSNLFSSDIEFWKFVGLPFQLNSLYWFLLDDGRKMLEERLKKWNLFQKNLNVPDYSVELGNKIGEDVKIEKNKQSLMDFMK